MTRASYSAAFVRPFFAGAPKARLGARRTVVRPSRLRFAPHLRMTRWRMADRRGRPGGSSVPPEHGHDGWSVGLRSSGHSAAWRTTFGVRERFGLAATFS